ncbi:MAG: enoyl-CoA hydratase-related protein [Burkholderiaceae bacterium]
MTEAGEQVLVDVADRIATVTLNRPEALNAMTLEMYDALRRTMSELGERTDVNVIVLTGAGRGFCAGVDMGRLAGMTRSGGLDSTRRLQVWDADPSRRPDYQQRYSFIAGIPKPVIASINGPAAGVGLVLALYCDLRFCAEGATMMTGFARRGLIAEHGSAWMLRQLVGPAHAGDLLLSSRKIDGIEAQRIGLVNRAVPGAELEAFTRRYARDMADTTSPLSLKGMKEQLSEVPFMTLGESLQDAERRMVVSLKSNDFKEGVAHFIEKRPPRFTGT